MCPGPLPGVMPGATGVVSPAALSRASRSRLGSDAVSSSESPVSGCGAPPRPSTTSMTILLSVRRQIWPMYGKSIISPVHQGVDARQLFPDR